MMTAADPDAIIACSGYPKYGIKPHRAVASEMRVRHGKPDRICRNCDDAGHAIKRLLESGQGLAEYALILALIAIIAIAALIFLGNEISAVFSTVGAAVDGVL